MYKKTGAWLLGLCLLAGLWACGGQAASTPGGLEPAPAPASATEESIAGNESTTTQPGETGEPVTGEQAPAPTAKDLVATLGTGWNLGNTLDTRAGGLCAETAWGNPQTTSDMLCAIKDAGFTAVRVPVTWQAHMGGAPEYMVEEAWMNRVNEVVDYVLDNGMVCILNTHHEDWLVPDEAHYEENSAQLAALWQQIASRFAGYSTQLVFEGMNEPRTVGTAGEWTTGTTESREVVNKLNAVFVETVRGTGGNNTARTLMLPAYVASHEREALEALVLPEDDNLIVSVHAYLPYGFALDPGGTNAFSASDAAGTEAIDALFDTLQELFLDRGQPVIIGETGALDKGNTQARVAWAQYYKEKALEYGVPLFVWDNGVLEGDGDLFGLLDRDTQKWVHPELVEALVGE